ncbi:AraC family transcriptional regulator [Paucibacter sp. R3-3]|uniref:AraC family transcriptional regulator n=1 Tax=Roseateles agri TaxID=3098619 RepID=A0ABU5DPB7_9BURK|nr:AraC family transcriptional regulator [Paucibacter sp. R3-3]MDY0748160.1 AraC family transcriptional regulator [Paucibacter sp. R3-3]
MQTTELKSLMQSLVPHKVFGGRRQEAHYEVAVQDIRWATPGEIRLLSGRHCLIELGEPPSPLAVGRAHYVIQAEDERKRAAGLLNVMPPDSSRVVSWNAGEHHAVVCVIEAEHFGLLGGIDCRWNEVDPGLTVDIRNPRLQTCMQWLAEEIARPAFGSALQVQNILTMLVLELHRHFAQGSGPCEPAPAGRLSAAQLARLRDLMESCGDPESLTLAALAQACGLPARSLSSMFKESTGQTLRSYVAASHIERAKLLLSDGGLLIKQVAYRSGFRNAAAFGDAFRKATGLTPVQYRQQLGLAGDTPVRTDH